METCNKTPLAQHGRSVKRLKPNTAAVRAPHRPTQTAGQPGRPPGRGRSLERQIQFEGRCRTLARPSVPAKASEDITHTSLCLRQKLYIAISFFFCGKSRFLVLKKQTMKVQWFEKCPVVSVVVYHLLITLNSPPSSL